MNTTQENTAKYVPTVIQYESYTYIGFITEKESNSDEIMPEVYRKFMGISKDGYFMKEKEKALSEDLVYKISLGSYFHAACELRENGKRYNLNKLRHELNNKQ